MIPGFIEVTRDGEPFLVGVHCIEVATPDGVGSALFLSGYGADADDLWDGNGMLRIEESYDVVVAKIRGAMGGGPSS